MEYRHEYYVALPALSTGFISSYLCLLFSQLSSQLALVCCYAVFGSLADFGPWNWFCCYNCYFPLDLVLYKTSYSSMIQKDWLVIAYCSI